MSARSSATPTVMMAGQLTLECPSDEQHWESSAGPRESQLCRQDIAENPDGNNTKVSILRSVEKVQQDSLHDKVRLIKMDGGQPNLMDEDRIDLFADELVDYIRQPRAQVGRLRGISADFT